ncbi:MAG TPA: efflux transporter outer membrane subunit [Polyangiales bacterium]|nr:efflux transporter outer membrane subunit [Polyangiales bacterium]
MTKLSSTLRAGAGALTFALCTNGCAVGPDYTKPDIQAPEQHRGEAVKTQTSIAELPWWRVFRDPVLSRYLKESLTNAYDVRMAAARIEQARAQARSAMWAFFPTFGAQVGVGGGKGLPGVPTIVPPGTLNGTFGASASVSWELDVWGRLRRQKEAADAFARAADEDQRAVYVALVGDVASTYIDLRTSDLKLEVVAASIQARQATADFFSERMKGGVSNDLEVSRAVANVADAKAQAALYHQQNWNFENQLAFLMARPPGQIERGVALDAIAMPPEVPAGLPSALLARRPDLRVAEEQLHAATAIVGVRVGDVLPKFALTGSAGVASSALTSANSETSAVYQGFAGLDIPIPLLGGATKLNDIDVAKARVNEQLAYYQKVFFNALREVSNALAAIDNLKEQRAQREAQVAALLRTEEIATVRYKGGISTYLEVITAQEQSLAAQLELAETKGLQHQAVIALYRALGGGWNMKEATEATAAKQ